MIVDDFFSQETRQISMICYGDPAGHSAMARTVGLPIGIATKMVLEGKLNMASSVNWGEPLFP